MKNLSLIVNDKKFEVARLADSQINIGDLSFEASLQINNRSTQHLSLNKKQMDVFCERISETEYDVWIKHHIVRVKIEDNRTQLMNKFKKDVQSKLSNIMIKAPMPGLVLAIEVGQDDIVAPSKGLIILEAMKMENEIKSTIHGKVKSIEVSEKMSVEKNQLLITLEPIE